MASYSLDQVTTAMPLLDTSREEEQAASYSQEFGMTDFVHETGG
jgi:hypothetical protein